jgi:hypothetical protein
LPADPDDDDINSRLTEIAAELAAGARFTEPRAADRLRVPIGSAQPPPARISPVQRWRNRRLAAELRKPVQSASVPSAPGPRRPPLGRAARHSLRSALARRAYRRHSARPQPVPDRGYATPSYRSPRRSLAILLAAMVILIALCGLVVAFMNRP